MVNRKIANAKKTSLDGITFDSKLELRCYELLKENNLDFDYNTTTFTLIDSFRLTNVHLYQALGKKKNLHMQINKDGRKLKVRAINYTPDFTKRIENKLFIIETKGYQNDVYPYKLKLFLDQCHHLTPDIEVYFFEPRNIKQIRQTIELVKMILDDTNSN